MSESKQESAQSSHQQSTDRPTFATYGTEFQGKIMQSLLMDKKFAEQMLEVFDTNYFELKYLQFLAERYFNYAKKYKEFPTLQLLVTIIKDELKNGSDLVLRNQIIEYLQKVRSNPNPGDLPFVKDKSLDFCRKQALKEALSNAVDLVATEKYESIVEVIKKAVSVGTEYSMGHNFFDDLEARYVNIKRACVPTGIEQLDRKEILNGGLGGGELGVACAATGGGKCSFRDTKVYIRYNGIKINGKSYKPWDKLRTKRGIIFARDILATDELIK